MVDLFMADWLPRKVAFAASTVAQVPYVADELAAAAVVAKGTTTAKAALIRDTFGLRTGDAAVTHPSIDDLSCWWRGR